MSIEKIKILLVEDNPGDIVLLRETLREMTDASYDLINVPSLGEAKTQIQKDSFDVVLLDLNLPDGKGLGNINELNETGMIAPIIIMTGLDDEKMAIEAVRKGAQDYLVKGKIDADLFWRSVRYAMERKRIDEKLKQAKETAEAGTRAKSEFLAHMSHEIRTPLNVIIGTADLLAGTNLDEVQKKYVESFKISSSTLLSLINDLLDLSKVEAGKMEIESIPFNLREIIEDIVKFMALAAKKKQNKLTYNIQDNIPDVILGDPQRLRQVIFNLLGNAIKFTSRGLIHLDVVADESKNLKISITDTGIGIEGDMLESIFHDFTQVDGSTARKYGGTGLGLSICKKLVKLWKGDLWAQSTMGTGSAFVFTHPLKHAQGAQEHRQIPHEQGVLINLSSVLENYSINTPLKILCVDDNPENLMLLKAYLSDLRILVEEASEGESALGLIKNQTYDLMLLDMQMPVMDGFTCATEIRKWEAISKKKPLTIIALTAYSQKEGEAKCLEAGCSGYISKPLVKENLFYQIAKFMSHPKSGPSKINGEQRQIKIDGSLKEIVPEYLERKKTEVETIKQAIGKNDFNSIEVIGHNMLGTGAPYGFHEISKWGKLIEIAAIQKDIPTLKEKVAELSDYLNEIKVTYT